MNVDVLLLRNAIGHFDIILFLKALENPLLLVCHYPDLTIEFTNGHQYDWQDQITDDHCLDYYISCLRIPIHSKISS